jgi:hypothetical protein
MVQSKHRVKTATDTSGSSVAATGSVSVAELTPRKRTRDLTRVLRENATLRVSLNDEVLRIVDRVW